MENPRNSRTLQIPGNTWSLYLSVCEWRHAPLCVYKLSDSFLNYFLYLLPSLSCALRPLLSRLDSAWSVCRLYPKPVPISLVYEAGGEIWLSKKIQCFWLARLWANDVSVAFCSRAMACAIHSLESLQFCSIIFPEELVFRLNSTCKTVFISPLIKTFENSLGIKIKTFEKVKIKLSRRSWQKKNFLFCYISPPPHFVFTFFVTPVQIHCPALYTNPALLLNSFFKRSMNPLLPIRVKWSVHDNFIPPPSHFLIS